MLAVVNMAILCMVAYLLVLLCSQASTALYGVTNSCCDLALRESAFIVNSSIDPEEYKCGQVYFPNADQSAAPDLAVTLSWCNGYDISLVKRTPGRCP